MNRTCSIVALLSILMSTSMAIDAGSVVVDDLDLDEGNVVALLEQTSQYYVDAMHELVNARYKDEYRAIRWEDLENAMTQARVARVEYHFEIDGRPRVRVYHAMGGVPLGVMGEDIFRGPTRPGTPVTPTDAGPPEAHWEIDEGDPAPNEPQRDLAGLDADDEVFFDHFDDIDVRARILPGQGSALPSFHIDGQDRALDPEMKALRHIEDDMKNKIVPSGGRIDAKIGGILCSSCRHAMQTMARAYDVDIRATQIFQTMPRRRQDAMLQSGRARMARGRLVDASSGRPLLAHDVLNGAREAQVRRSLGVRSLDRSLKGVQWSKRSFLPAAMGSTSDAESPLTRRASNPDVDEPSTPGC
ncbi:hypothetical protein [Luteibacter yeojuensis]|uniref:Uncharacterized protein n=1 Tax=Luteibacter yeojuensis TaxID=345309 RepID=A0A7X5QVF8_9GAMM|nr:hypothetical protein [Luteibacter yeojuensis]NID16149.1 hypothetical protein [Luteibacter yeojuensis]